jgi:hypothetical protein
MLSLLKKEIAVYLQFDGKTYDELGSWKARD